MGVCCPLLDIYADAGSVSRASADFLNVSLYRYAGHVTVDDLFGIVLLILKYLRKKKVIVCSHNNYFVNNTCMP